MSSARPYLAVLEVTVRLPDAHCLKDKRAVTQSIKDGVRRRFGVAVAEIDGLDERRRAVLLFAGLATARPRADGLLARLEAHLERYFGGHDLTFESRVVEL